MTSGLANLLGVEERQNHEGDRIMAERIAVLEVIPVVPAVLAFGGQKIMQRSWDGMIA